MAVARIKKLNIVSHNSIREGLLEGLQDLGVVHISGIKNAPDGEFKTEDRKREELSIRLSQIEEMIKFLSSIEQKKAGFLGEKVFLRLEEFKSIYQGFDYKEVYEGFRALKDELKELNSKKEKLLEKKRKLLPWESLDVEPEDLGGTRNTGLILGFIQHKDFSNLTDQLNREKPAYHFEIVNSDKNFEYLIFICLEKEKTVAEEILKRCNFNRVQLELSSLSARKELKSIDRSYILLSEREHAINDKLNGLLRYKPKLMHLYDYCFNIRKKTEAEKDFLNTKEAFMIEGWIREHDLKPLKRMMDKNFSHFELQAREPSHSDIVPVELENKAAVTPFEFITKIYGLPSYGELDPTPFLAPFFFIFFGFCLTDAGYGVIVALLSLWAILKLKPGRYWRSFFWLLFLGGVSTVLLGAVTGGWFGDIIDILNTRFPKIFSFLAVLKNRLILLDPNKEPIKLLAIALSIGIVQIFTGNLIALYDNIRKKHILDGILDQVSVLVFLTGFTGLVLIMLEALDKGYGTLFGRMAQIGALVIILTAGRANHGIGAKLFNGVFAFYNVAAGYISDALSYSRLWALGLVTGVMAMTCNLIAFMIGDMIPLVGFLVTILILFVGHVFTIAINVLGGLIHSGRLQYVEFFPKFFKGGGGVFSPLRMENKYIVIEKM